MSYLFSCSDKYPRWEVAEDGVTVMNGPEVVADVHGTQDEFYAEETQGANARLIAEAPTMYRLLEHLSFSYMHYRDEDRKAEAIEKIIEDYRKLRMRAECEYVTRHIGQLNRQEEQE